MPEGGASAIGSAGRQVSLSPLRHLNMSSEDSYAYTRNKIRLRCIEGYLLDAIQPSI
jgi:hypothetical protein